MSRLADCDCVGWQVSMRHIVAAQLLAANHRMPYTGNVFEYCPWCGKLRAELSEVGQQPATVEMPHDDTSHSAT